MFRFVGGPHAS
jgi:hypothetical protein